LEKLKNEKPKGPVRPIFANPQPKENHRHHHLKRGRTDSSSLPALLDSPPPAPPSETHSPSVNLQQGPSKTEPVLEVSLDDELPDIPEIQFDEEVIIEVDTPPRETLTSFPDGDNKDTIQIEDSSKENSRQRLKRETLSEGGNSRTNRPSLKRLKKKPKLNTDTENTVSPPLPSFPQTKQESSHTNTELSMQAILDEINIWQQGQYKLQDSEIEELINRMTYRIRAPKAAKFVAFIFPLFSSQNFFFLSFLIVFFLCSSGSDDPSEKTKNATIEDSFVQLERRKRSFIGLETTHFSMVKMELCGWEDSCRFGKTEKNDSAKSNGIKKVKPQFLLPNSFFFFFVAQKPKTKSGMRRQKH
jgi:hypothetical protein